ncbi:hypothetical protein FM076_01565 [Streptomyces albus subsp. chlorinus]|uniref:hypothetical protein n=1 Tax=Streptomyces albus TaxID=1888 RepID=UPI001570C2AA|nr:hypothetical protein [Streptomyces albus]NSC19965.1 hypothetical protein [Streptomyces albus subsp. chlorinus]
MTSEPLTPIQERYAKQFAEDLKKNHEAQQRVKEEIARLQEQLTQLQQDAEWLSQLYDSRLGTAPAGAETSDGAAASSVKTDRSPAPSASGADAAKSADEPVVPRPRERKAPAGKNESAGSGKRKPKKTVAARAAKKSSPKPNPRSKPKPGAKPKAAAGKKTAPKSSAGTSSPRKGRATMPDLAEEVLRGRDGQPATVKEVLQVLQKNHAEHTFSAPGVRNYLESLVAKGRAERMKQKNSVLYVSRSQSASAEPSSADSSSADGASPDNHRAKTQPGGGAEHADGEATVATA